MKLRNAHSTGFRLPSGQLLAPGESGPAPESMRDSALVKAGVFVVVEEPKTETAAPSPKPPRSVRGGR